MKRTAGVVFLIALLNCVSSPVAAAGDMVLDSIGRHIGKEPQYESTPQYSLLALGPEAKTMIWMVEDGRRLYVDNNGNGDLTDDGAPLSPSNEREFQRSVESDAKSWDFDYLLAEFQPVDGAPQKDFQLRRWNYGEAADSYGLSLTLDGKVPMYAGWFGTFWADSPDKAPIIHFGGALTPRVLREREFTIGSGVHRLSIGFMGSGSAKGAESRLNIDALGADVVPVVEIDWPVPEGAAQLRTRHSLNERCCYWEFYTSTFEVPKDAAVGKAKLKIELPLGAMPLSLTTTELEVPVVAGAESASAQ